MMVDEPVPPLADGGVQPRVIPTPTMQRPSSYSCALGLVMVAGLAASFVLLGSEPLRLAIGSSSETALWKRSTYHGMLGGGARGNGTFRGGAPQYEVNAVSSIPTLPVSRHADAQHQQRSKSEPPPPPQEQEQEHKQPLFNASSCVWLNIVSSVRARSGNRLSMLRQVHQILAMCSGVATSMADGTEDPTVVFLPVLIATAATSEARLNHTALEAAAGLCRELNYTGIELNDVLDSCHRSGPAYRVQQSWESTSTTGGSMATTAATGGLKQPTLLPYVSVEKRAWEFAFNNSTMLMFFRGGDILQVNTNARYSQGPCSLFLEAWNLLTPKHAMLIYDRHAAVNPCVEVMEKHIPAQQRIEPPCDGVGCHMTLIGRAPYVVVSGTSTFATYSFSLFPETTRLVFQYFCDHKPRIKGSSLHVCANGSTQGLVPWNYTDTTKQLMLDLPSRIVLGDYNASSLKDYVA